MRDGVYRLLDGRFRVQLGDDFLGNYASEGAAALVATRVYRPGLDVPANWRCGKACEVRLSGGAWQRFASQSLAVRAFPGLAENTLSALLNHPSECPATVRARFEARRVVAENVYVSYRPRQKPCPECHELVGCRANECPGCGYDFKGAREAPAPVSLTRRGAATLGVRIKLGGRVAPGISQTSDTRF